MWLMEQDFHGDFQVNDTWFFACFSGVNTNESLKCNRQDHSTICSYRSLHKVGYVPLYTVRKSLFGIPATGL